MRELSLHILDIAENGITAGADCIQILVDENRRQDLLTLAVTDNGRGMPPEKLNHPTDPFITSRTTRRVGMGLSLLEIVADKIAVIAVGDVADALGEEGIVDLDLLQTDRSLLARDFGESGQFVHKIALRHAPHGERESGAERETVKNRGKRKADKRGRERAAENHDKRMHIGEHAQIAAQ